MLPSYSSDPHVQYLSQLIEEIERGQLLVPRFQRPLIWDLDQQLELLRSVRDGIPFGAILVWRTKRTDVLCYESVGPFRLPSPAAGDRQYILDGVQRLSVLYNALHKFDPKAFAEPEEDRFELYYDLEQEVFLVADPGELRPEMLPLSILFDSTALLRFQRRLEGDSAERWIEGADRLAKAFREYKVSVIPFATDDMGLAARTFLRINIQGDKMGEIHIVHALTYSDSFDLQEKVENLRQGVFDPLGWGDLNPDWLLYALKAAFGLAIYSVSAQELSKELSRRPDYIEEVGASMQRAIHFLHDPCGVPSPSLVPYTFQAVLLTEAFRLEPEPEAELRELLHAWFWLTTFGDAFTGISGYRLGLVADDVRHMVARCEPRWSFPRSFQYRRLPARSDFRSVRVKALALQLAARQGEDGRRLLAEYDSKALGTLVPRNALAQESRYFSSGNRFLAQPQELKKLRVQLSSPDPGLLEKHVIFDRAFEHYQAGAYDLFLEKRREDLEQLERELVEPLARIFGFV